MQQFPQLEQDKYYHIYNRGINSEKIFLSSDNYSYFLKLYLKYIEPIASTFAYALMPNHFHFLIRIKAQNTPVRVSNPDRGENRNLPPYRYFSHLFNSYTQSFNKYHERHGSLFERPFKRKEIDNEDYLKYMVYYIHNNPIHHKFTKDLTEYLWTSFSSILSEKQTHIERMEVLSWFEDVENFKFFHHQDHNMDRFRNYLID